MSLMKTSSEIRLENLLLLIQEAGSDEALAEKYECSPPYIKQLRLQSPDSKTGKPKGIGDKTARKLEECMGKPRGWIDTQHVSKSEESDIGKANVTSQGEMRQEATGTPAPPDQAKTVTGLLESLREKISEQPEPIRAAIANLVSSYVMSPNPETGQEVAAMIEKMLGDK